MPDKPVSEMSDDEIRALAGVADPVAARVGYLRACIGAAQVAPEAFDLSVLLGGFAAALGALEAVLALHVPGRVMIMGSLCAKHEAHRHFSISITEANDVRDCPDCGAAVLTTCTGCGAVYGHCPDLRAIRRELLVDDVDAALLGQEAADHD
jgi:hypothetical protein